MESRSEKMRAHGFVTAARAAKVCGCSSYKIYRMIADGAVVGKAIDGHHYVEAGSLAAYYAKEDPEGLLGITREALLAAPQKAEAAR